MTKKAWYFVMYQLFSVVCLFVHFFSSEGTHAYIANFNLLTRSYSSQSPSANSADVTHRFLGVSGVFIGKKKPQHMMQQHRAEASVLAAMLAEF